MIKKISKDFTFLKKRCKEVKLPFSLKDEKIMENLISYVRKSQNKKIAKKEKLQPAVGLAANQIGECKRMYFIRIKKANKIIEYAIVNPEIISFSEQITTLSNGEGCLSVDEQKTNFSGFVPRRHLITVSAYDYFSKEKKIFELSGLESIIFQHEQDHLEGKFFFERINHQDPWSKKKEWIICELK